MAANKFRLLIYVKYPRPGEVKTRLAREVGAERAVMFYDACVRDTMSAAADSGLPYTIYAAPGAPLSAYRMWLGAGLDYRVQRGDSLGERMKQGCRAVLDEGHNGVILVGSDIPQLSALILREAAAVLKRHDAVIGGAADGGYYLIGFRAGAFHGDVFDGITWSRDTVFAETAAKFVSHQIRYAELPRLVDVDRYDDWQTVYRQMSRSSQTDSHTFRFLKEYGPRDGI